MAGPASGLRTVIATGEESTYGTPVAVDRRIPIISESFQFTPSYLESEMMDGEPAYLERSATREENTRGGTGQLVIDVPMTSIGRLLEHMIGGDSAIVQEAATTAWTQTHEFGSLTGKSLTVQKVLRAADGTVVASHRYHGCKITTWELTLATQARPRLTVGFDFEDEETGFETTTILGLPVIQPDYFTFKHGSLLVAAVAAARVTEFSISGNNNLSVDDHFVGGAGLKVEPEFAGNRELSGNATYQLLDLADFYTRFTDNTGVALQLAFEGPEIESPHNFDLIFDVPRIHFTGDTPQVGGPGIVTPAAPWVARYNDVDPPITVTYKSTDTEI